MHQVVNAQSPTRPHSEMEQESLSVKRDDIKYLPCTAEHTENYFGTNDLSSRCISPVMTEKDNDDHYVHLAKNIVFTLDPTYFDSIDEVSWRNIADGLKFSGIDNQWLSKPPYILARHGIFTQPKLSVSLPLGNIKDNVEEQLSEDDKSILARHRLFFSGFPYHNKGKPITWSSDKVKKLSDYILSGEAGSNFKHLSNQIVDVSSDYKYLLHDDRGVCWKGDNSCFFVAEHSKDFF
ncbi:hypothetical protein [Endozoicomonas acroporae]|uniref:hypothetical protein n=1 Tax=Endozoicomonas acroporae TaxID=1701104 RepID=UPI003D78F575